MLSRQIFHVERERLPDVGVPVVPVVIAGVFAVCVRNFCGPEILSKSSVVLEEKIVLSAVEEDFWEFARALCAPREREQVMVSSVRGAPENAEPLGGELLIACG